MGSRDLFIDEADTALGIFPVFFPCMLPTALCGIFSLHISVSVKPKPNFWKIGSVWLKRNPKFGWIQNFGRIMRVVFYFSVTALSNIMNYFTFVGCYNIGPQEPILYLSKGVVWICILCGLYSPSSSCNMVFFSRCMRHIPVLRCIIVITNIL